jgi:hypothetical protein
MKKSERCNECKKRRYPLTLINKQGETGFELVCNDCLKRIEKKNIQMLFDDEILKINGGSL